MQISRVAGVFGVGGARAQAGVDVGGRVGQVVDDRRRESRAISGGQQLQWLRVVDQTARFVSFLQNLRTQNNLES